MYRHVVSRWEGIKAKGINEKFSKASCTVWRKYRIIDFALSNCKNSSIDTVGILTQYKQETLQTYIEDGGKWGLNRKIGGVAILQPIIMT